MKQLEVFKKKKKAPDVTRNRSSAHSITSSDYSFEQLTNQLFVPGIQSHVAQRRSHRAHHPVVIHPQQLNQNGQTLLLTHCCSDISCELMTRRTKRK